MLDESRHGAADRRPVRSVHAARAHPPALHQHRGSRHLDHDRRFRAGLPHASGNEHHRAAGRGGRPLRAGRRRRLALAGERRPLDQPQPAGRRRAVRRLPAAHAALRFAPSLVVNGLGLRVGKIGAAARRRHHAGVGGAARVRRDQRGRRVTGGGVQLQFSNLAVSASGAQGDNGIAQGIMRDTGYPPSRLLAGARDPGARRRGAGLAHRGRRHGPMVDRHPEGLRAAVPGADRLRHRHAAGPAGASRC